MLVLEYEGLGYVPMNVLKPVISFWDGIKVYCNYAELSGNSTKLNKALVDLRMALRALLENIASMSHQTEIVEAYGITDVSQADPMFAAIGILNKAGKTAAICSTVTAAKFGASLASLIQALSTKKDEQMITAKAKAVIIQYNADQAPPPSPKPPLFPPPGDKKPPKGKEPPPAEYVPPAKMITASMFTARNIGIVMVGGAVLAAGYSVWQKRKNKLAL